MKKLFLLATIVVAGFVNAKNIEETKPTQEAEKKEAVSETEYSESEVLKYKCIEYAMYIPCQDFFLTDQVCWGEGTGVPTWDDAWNCITENGEMATFHFCNQ